MTRKDLNQIYDLMEKLDNIKLDQEFIEKVSDKGYDPFEVILRFKYPNKNQILHKNAFIVFYDLIKKDIEHQIKEMSNYLDGMVVINTNELQVSGRYCLIDDRPNLVGKE